MKTVGESFGTDQKADAILKCLLPERWLPRRQNPDFHVDYVVEVVNAGELTGAHFGVQLKGTQPKMGKCVKLKHSLSTKHVRYYVEKVQIPVFLVLVDVTTRKAFWCFIQKNIFDSGTHTKLRTQRSVTVSFAQEDCLDNLDRFKSAVMSAIEYVKELHPGTVPSAIKHQVQKLRDIDPRMDVNLSYKNGRQNVALQANEEFEFSAFFKEANTPEFKEAISSFWERGTDLKVKSSSIEFKGAPLLAYTFAPDKNEIITLNYSRKVPGTVQFFGGSKLLDFLFQVDGVFRCGTKYASLEIDLPKSVLALGVEISFETLVRSESQNLSISFNLSGWTGQCLLQLSYFEQIMRFAEHLIKGWPILMKIQSDGNSLLDSTFTPKNFDGLTDVWEIFDLLVKARFIALKFNVNPPTPALHQISRKQARIIENIYELLHKRAVRAPRPNFRTTLTVVGRAVQQDPLSKSDFRIVSPKHKFDFFGLSLTVGPIRHRITEVILERFAPAKNGNTDLFLKGTEASEWIMELDDSAIIPQKH